MNKATITTDREASSSVYKLEFPNAASNVALVSTPLNVKQHEIHVRCLRREKKDKPLLDNPLPTNHRRDGSAAILGKRLLWWSSRRL